MNNIPAPKKRGRKPKIRPIQQVVDEKNLVNETIKQDTPINEVEPSFNQQQQTTNSINEINNNFDPLTNEPVIQRGYGTMQIPDNGQPIPDIPEPKFTPPSAQTIFEEPKFGGQTIPPNPQMNDLSDKDKRDAAERLVDGVFQIWSWLKSLAGKKAVIDIDKVKRLHKEMKLDMNILIPLGDGRTASFLEIVLDFNKQSEEAFIVTEDFINKVREPMIREFMKRNIGLTDMQTILVFWSMEIATTGYHFIDIKKKANEVLEGQIALKQANKSTNQKPKEEKPKDVSEPAKEEYSEVGEDNK